MKLVKMANGKKTVKMSKKEWASIGKKAGWMKKAQYDDYGGDYYDDGERNGPDLINDLRDSGELPSFSEQDMRDFPDYAQELRELNSEIETINNSFNDGSVSIEDFVDQKYKFIQKLENMWSAIDAERQDMQEERANLEYVLKKYNYDINAIEKALGVAQSRLEQEEGREDWVADFAPTGQGFYDAQDAHNEALWARGRDVDKLEKAIDFLERLQSSRRTAKVKYKVKTIKL